ncbi:collagen-like protein [Bacteroides thetaiotaomicron]|uniref:collagen-like protein n=1 Tax=Bacteroides thetaiotaomicron TaxID=818 RepID=UPI001F2B15AA|nr:collagen-like protein [Bacteroides thetaiotaomicron]
MAILSNGKFYGFLCSVKETGRKLANGVKEYVEDFMSGFAGHGWKLWEYMTGKWKLEIDTIVVRETMLVFEMLISKIRAIIGAQTISQGHGKVKSARISDDGTEYLIELEDEDVSIVAHDFVRCQTFVGDKTKLYHVEVSSVDVETKTLHVPLSEFDKDESGNVLNVPAAGDELVQFGNSQNKARQSAIYMHADETGQPAIDVMFDLNSKNWEGKVKVRVGGDIPGSGGLKGFYCVNGMIKGVDSKGNVAYCIYPDGTAELGCGAALFKPDKSGHIAGGAISWIWDESNQKCVCTMKDVVLTWDNLSDDAKENLKGEPGKDGTDGLSIVWKGDSSIPPSSPEKNWAYRDTDNGRVYIYNGTAWALMVADGTDGEPGKDGMRVYITYHDSEEKPEKPVGDGTTNGWHTDSTESVIWISQKVSESADSGEWGDPIRVKGEPGKDGQDANLLPWIEKWNGYATELGEEYIVTPKMFSGTKSADGKLTGIAQGKDCLTAADGTTRTGIFALVDNEIVFELDPVMKKYLFKGRVESGASKGNRIIIDPESNSLKMYDEKNRCVTNIDFSGNPSSFSWPQIRMTAFSVEGKVSGRTTIRADYIGLERGSWDSGESSTDDYRSITIDSTEIAFYEKGTMVKRINAHN